MSIGSTWARPRSSRLRTHCLHTLSCSSKRLREVWSCLVGAKILQRVCEGLGLELLHRLYPSGRDDLNAYRVGLDLLEGLFRLEFRHLVVQWIFAVVRQCCMDPRCTHGRHAPEGPGLVALREGHQPTQRPANGADSSGGGRGGAFGIPDVQDGLLRFGIPEVQYIPGSGVSRRTPPCRIPEVQDGLLRGSRRTLPVPASGGVIQHGCRLAPEVMLELESFGLPVGGLRRTKSTNVLSAVRA